MNISAIVLTKNEEKNIERCLQSISFCNEIIVVDDYSTDKTLEKIQNPKSQILNKSKIKIFKRHLHGDFAEQRNYAMKKASNDWVLFIDADEEIADELREEIISLDSLLRGNDNVAYYIKRRDYWWGREMKFGETLKVRNRGIIRLVKKNSGKWIGNVHEEFKVKSQKSTPIKSGSKVKSLNGYIDHYPHQSVKEFLQDINMYSSLRAQELFRQGRNTNILEIMFFPAFKFILNYFFFLGFLDGPAGFAYAFFMSFHSFLVRTKLYTIK